MSENKKTRFFKEKTSPQILLLDFVAEWSIDDPSEKMLRRNRYILAHSPKMKEKVSHQKTFFPQGSIGHQNAVSTTAVENFSQKAQNVYVTVRKV